MQCFSDTVVVFGVSREECLEALEHCAAEIWAGVDEAMDLLWDSEEERSAAEETFGASALLAGPLEERPGAVKFEIDYESDVVGERLSGILGRPVIAIQTLTDRWCKFVAFDEGSRLGWLFWVDPSTVVVDGEVVSASVATALDRGGWIGDPEVFEAFLPPTCRSPLRDILDAEWGDPADLADEVKALLGFPRQAGVRDRAVPRR